MIGHLNCHNAVKILKIVNRTILAEYTNTPFTPNELQGKFASFVIENPKKLAEEKFPFHEIEPQLLQFIFSRIKEA
jgi:hypothetical protein